MTNNKEKVNMVLEKLEDYYMGDGEDKGEAVFN
mgnify:CR=1 FL=1